MDENTCEYQSKDGSPRRATLTIPPGYKPPKTLKLPLISSWGSGYMIFSIVEPEGSDD